MAAVLNVKYVFVLSFCLLSSFLCFFHVTFPLPRPFLLMCSLLAHVCVPFIFFPLFIVLCFVLIYPSSLHGPHVCLLFALFLFQFATCSTQPIPLYSIPFIFYHTICLLASLLILFHCSIWFCFAILSTLPYTSFLQCSQMPWFVFYMHISPLHFHIPSLCFIM